MAVDDDSHSAVDAIFGQGEGRKGKCGRHADKREGDLDFRNFCERRL